MTPNKHDVALTLALARISLLRDGGPDWQAAMNLIGNAAQRCGEALAAGCPAGSDHSEAGAGESALPQQRTPASALGEG